MSEDPKITWINPAEVDPLATDPDNPWKLSETASTDPWRNHHRDWRLERPFGSSEERIIITSGSNGIKLCVCGYNNGFVSLDPKTIKLIIKELKKAPSYSKWWWLNFRSYWRRSNSDE